MGEAFEQTDGLLAEKLMAVLEAGQRAGGDRRGQQAAGMLVVRPNAYFDGPFDRLVDIRVDDHPEPIQELKKLLEIALPSVHLLNTRLFVERGQPARERAVRPSFREAAGAAHLKVGPNWVPCAHGAEGASIE